MVGPADIEDIAVSVGMGGRIERATAELTYLVTDGEITGTFRAARPMELEADGRWLALTMVETNPGTAFVIEPRLVDAGAGDGRMATRRLTGVELYSEQWGTASAFTPLAWQPGGHLLARVVADEAGLRVVVEDADDVAGSWTLPGTAPAWSPEGERLAAVEAISGTVVVLVVADATTGAVTSRRRIDLPIALAEGFARDRSRHGRNLGPHQPAGTRRPGVGRAALAALAGWPLARAPR